MPQYVDPLTGAPVQPPAARAGVQARQYVDPDTGEPLALAPRAVGAPPPPITSIPLRKPWELIEQPVGPVAVPPPEPSFLQEMGAAIDPRTRQGRRNIAGGVGAAAATAGLVATAPVSLPAAGLSLATGGVLGALGGGMAAEAGEQLVGTAPPSTAGVLTAGAQQGAYEVAGQALLWPIKIVGRRVIASRVAKGATEALGRSRRAIESQLEAALSTAQEAVRATRRGATDVIRRARGEARGRTRAVEIGASQELEIAQEQVAQRVAGAERPFEALVGQPPSATAAGRSAQAVIEGPARTARDLVGQQVEEAAKSGPPVDITALKAEAQRILSEEIAPPQTAFPRALVEDPAGAALAEAGIAPEVAAQMTAAGGPNAQALQEALAGAQAEAARDVLKHPAMGVLNRILNAEDSVPFHAAHQFKRELDEAIGAAWDQSVRKKVTNVTKTLRGSLREALGLHEPYNTATAAYAAIAPLYTKGLAPQLRKLATEAPEAIVRLIKSSEPTKARMLRDLIVTQSAEAGRAAEGQAAWDAVRSAWTHDHVIKGSVDTLADRIAILDPEFTGIFYGDQTGQQVLRSLRQIASAYRAAVEQGAELVAQTKAAGKTAVRTAQDIGRETIEQARVAKEDLVGRSLAELQATRQARAQARRVTPEEEAFKASTVAPFAQRASQMSGADMLRAVGLGPFQIWGALSIIRLLNGPRASDLLRWAAYSPRGTQMLVQALTRPVPGMTAADLLRASGIGAEEDGDALQPSVMGEAQVGTPPPPP
jgi:hypothetical protein